MALHDHAIRLSDKGMRILHFPLIRLIIALIFLAGGVFLAAVLADLINALLNGKQNGMLEGFVQMILVSGFSILAYWFYCGLVEGTDLNDMKMKHLASQLGIGILLGLGFISIIMIVLALTGNYHVMGWNKISVLFPVFVISIQAGIMEEIMGRGIIFRIVEDGLGTFFSILISAFIFGFLHSWNDNATWFSSVSIALTAGLVLALLYVWTRQLWIPIGMHFAWNFTLGGIYGAPVSGGDRPGLLNSTLEGADWLTGGDFGPEASIITIVIFGVFALFLTWMVIKKGLYKCPAWIKKGN